MKRTILILGLILILLSGCTANTQEAQIAATTLPVYEFTVRLCQGTDLTVTRLVTENVSCQHDYTLSVRQVRAVEAAELVILSGAGLEEFMSDLLEGSSTVDAAAGIELLSCGHEHDRSHHHDHETDAHIWLSPVHAMTMASNICEGLCSQYPLYDSVFRGNLADLLEDLSALQIYGQEQLSDLSCRELITFHDGFSYFAEAFDLEILETVEEESGSEASAAELKHLIGIVEDHALPAIFTERSGSSAAAAVIAAETGATVYTLDMAMSGDSYFDAMYRNIDTIKEALE